MNAYNEPYHTQQPQETEQQTVKRRNKRVEALFNRLGFEVTLIGDENKPAIVLDKYNKCLSAYVHNFELRFVKSPSSNEIVHTHKLIQNPTQNEIKKVFETIENTVHKDVFKIGLYGTQLSISGWNYLDRENSSGIYPVFSKHRVKIYFSRERAEEIVEKFGKEYNLFIH
jgi:hypothetical protein